jgi:branched-chain amino acid transport system permease protein
MSNVLASFYVHHSRLIDQIGINALLALSLSVSLQAGQLALAQAAFMGIAGYVGAIGAVQRGWPLWESMLAGALASALAAAVLALPIGRLRGVFLAIATVGFGEIARTVENNLPITGGAEGLSGIPDDASTPWIYGTLIAVGCVIAAASRSKFALAVAATREDEGAARGVGIDTARVRFCTLTFFIAPGDFGFGRMEQILVACVIGGVTSSLGALVGATLMTVLPEFIRFLADFRDVTSGAILLGIVLFAPRGIAGLWKRGGRA